MVEVIITDLRAKAALKKHKDYWRRFEPDITLTMTKGEDNAWMQGWLFGKDDR